MTNTMRNAKHILICIFVHARAFKKRGHPTTNNVRVMDVAAMLRDPDARVRKSALETLDQLEPAALAEHAHAKGRKARRHRPECTHRGMFGRSASSSRRGSCSTRRRCRCRYWRGRRLSQRSRRRPRPRRGQRSPSAPPSRLPPTLPMPHSTTPSSSLIPLPATFTWSPAHIVRAARAMREMWKHAGIH